MNLKAWFQAACDRAIELAMDPAKNQDRLKECVARLRYYREVRIDDPEAAKTALTYVWVVIGHLDSDLTVARSLEAEMDRHWGPSSLLRAAK